MLYRFEHTADWDPHQFGIAVHAEAVRIHPFADGNGRTTRLLANLLFLAAQEGEQLQEYDWDIDKDTYISLLRAYDQDRDAGRLADFIKAKPFGVQL
jgi:Fic family protein